MTIERFSTEEMAAAFARVDAEEIPPIHAGEWVRPPLDEPFLWECCDCHVVHAIKFDHDDTGRIIFAVERLDLDS